MIEVRFKHWKTGEELIVRGDMQGWMNEQSDRIVVKKEDGSFEDIIKSTIKDIRKI
jgi:hypothetical protein